MIKPFLKINIIRVRIKIAIIGTQGLPNKYGGFETLVEHLTKNLAEEFEITVFCSSKIYPEKIRYYNNATLRYLPFHANGLQSVIYDSFSLFLSLRYDKILILGSSGGLIMPLFRSFSNKFILNFGGLDWQRSKWGNFQQKFLKLSEKLSINNSGLLIADNEGIQNYISEKYKRDSHIIEYGGDQVSHENITAAVAIKYSFLNMPYAFSVARIQSDNNIDLVLEAFENQTKIPMVFVGNWGNSNYGIALEKKYKNHKSIILLNAIYDMTELNILRSNCKIYIHGHSAGGTNPSLVEAMNLGLPVICYSSVYNKYTTESQALYFDNKNELTELISSLSHAKLFEKGIQMYEIAKRRYKWSIIAEKYSNLFSN